MIASILVVVIPIILLLKETNNDVKHFFEKHSKIGIIVIIILLISSLITLYQQSIKDDALATALSNEGDINAPSTTLFTTEAINDTNIAWAPGNSNFNMIGPAGEQIFQRCSEDAPRFMPDLVISKNNKQQLLVSTQIRGKNGLVAKIVNNHWITNPNNVMRKRYNDSVFEVEDNNGDIVLQVVLKNDRVQLQGKFYDENGNGFAIFEAPEPWGAVELTGPNHPKLNVTIKSVFSQRHDVSSQISDFILSLSSFHLVK
jgi:hypothetical protein